MMISDRNGRMPAGALAAVSPAATAEAVAAAAAVIAAAYVPDVRITPLAGRIAAELGVDIAKVRGSGSGGKIYSNDVRDAFETLRAGEARIETEPERAYANEAPRPAVTAVTSAVAAKDYSAITAFTQHMEIDVTELFSLCEHMQIAPTAFFMKAAAVCLLEFEQFRMRPAGAGGAYSVIDEAHIGLEFSSGDGAQTPVLRNSDMKSLEEIAAEVAVLTEKVKRGGLSESDVTGATVSLIDKGKSCIASFAPVLRLPEVAVLGMGAPYERLVMTDKSIENKKYIMQSLTFDQRVISGAAADGFQRKLKEILESPALLLAG